MYPGVVLQAGRDLDRVGDDITTIGQRIKGMRGQGAMHPTAAAAFDLMVSSQVARGDDLARFTHMAADRAERSAHVVRWADESSTITGSGWRPGRPSTFLDGLD